jgi:septum formation protein
MYSRWLPFINSKRVILCSGSLQRQLLLKELGIEFIVKTSDFPENLEKINPREYVENTCNMKFEEFIKRNKDHDFDILITADTIIQQNNHIIEKPSSEDDIYQWFHNYSNNNVICLTSVIIGIFYNNNGNTVMKKLQFTNETIIYFDTITDEMISDYIKTGEPYNRAGGFAIQGYGKTFIKKIEGDYYNVTGLPVQELCKNLISMLIDIYGQDAWKLEF